jgi:hypothetical protein
MVPSKEDTTMPTGLTHDHASTSYGAVEGFPPDGLTWEDYAGLEDRFTLLHFAVLALNPIDARGQKCECSVHVRCAPR